MINWNEVTVGETEIERDGIIAKIIGLYEKWVWVKCHEATWIRLKDDMTDWTIYDPWEEITEECEWVCIDNTLMVYLIHYKGNALSLSDKGVKSNGRRVWKRKEG